MICTGDAVSASTRRILEPVTSTRSMVCCANAGLAISTPLAIPPQASKNDRTNGFSSRSSFRRGLILPSFDIQDPPQDANVHLSGEHPSQDAGKNAPASGPRPRAWEGIVVVGPH